MRDRGFARSLERSVISLADAVIRRLLGPAGPEIGCEECFRELDRYVELRIAGADAEAAVPGMAPNRDGCPACPVEHSRLAELVAR